MKRIILVTGLLGASLLLSGCTTTLSSRGLDGICKVEIKDGDKIVKSCVDKCSDLDTFKTNCKNSK